MIYSTRITVTANTKSNTLILITEDGRRIALTFSPKRQDYVHVVINDLPVAMVSNPKHLIRWLVQKLNSPAQIEAQFDDFGEPLPSGSRIK